MKKVTVILLVVLLAATAIFAQGQTETGDSSYPLKKITFICPSAAGGAMDSNTRICE